jgi:tetratricopeptide (TPR) repeat protein
MRYAVLVFFLLSAAVPAWCVNFGKKLDSGPGIKTVSGPQKGGSNIVKSAGGAAGAAWNSAVYLKSLPPQVVADARSGDKAAALAAANEALARNPGDRALYAFIEENQPPRESGITRQTVAERAKELLAGLRGDAGAPPAGAAVEASAIGLPALGAAAGLPRAAGFTPQALKALAGGRPGADFLGPDPLVRDAAGKLEIRDFGGAVSLLNRRLAQAPDDEAALRLRAFARREERDFPGSAGDARSALGFKSDDSRARRLLVDDLVDLGRSEEGLKEANAALAARPDDAQVLAARADVWASLGRRQLQLADLKKAAALDAQFDQLYQQAASAGAAPAPAPRGPGAYLVWLGAIGTALLFFSFALFRKRGDSSVRLAMRAEDHAALLRGAEPEAAPRGFKILRTLGQGGMGVVYEALDLGLQRPVALKKLRAEIAENPRERARFLKEARIVAGLKHPNIVEIHSIHEDDEGLFLVFERVDGESLHERLDRGVLPPAEAVACLRQVAKALDHAHERGVVHQDLKPSNVMVAGDSAKVMDFGIARQVQKTLSTLSKVAGTPAYMAPEQELGAAVGPAADVFALGACAYELLVGRPPFPNGGAMMKSERLYVPLSQARGGMPVQADAALARALDPEPSSRWPSASSFVDALARSLAA